MDACAKRANDAKYRLNLATNWEALYRPQLKLRHLLENRKSHIVDGDTIGNIESNPSSFEADPEARVVYEATHQDTLNWFYNDPELKHLRHDRDAGRARRAEFALLTDGLLSMVRELSERKESQPKSGHWDQTWEIWNEHKVDVATQFIQRIFHWKGCKTYFRRDEMAAGDTVNAICSQLQKNKRPNYPLPIDESGNFVIKRQSTSEITARDQGADLKEDEEEEDEEEDDDDKGDEEEDYSDEGEDDE
ncbi:hypothetical protein BGZ80_004233 [Entomortierella chlamydospora]|uniref:Uncharacterized protein n=1 Tax=Entomortierella chlamydospora TaxID=101097 RepID=A0A9P6MN28_9FUNG|nr:hypothetical protein BGZ80_004233 [Entomortierella chlamydospora]